MAVAETLTDDQLGTAAFIFQDELKSWRIIEFDLNNVRVVHADGDNHGFPDKFRAEDFIKQRAATALIRFYRETLKLDDDESGS